MKPDNHKFKLLFLGQTPPPYYGQAISHQVLIDASYAQLEIYHVRMHFSSSMSEIGKFRVSKIFHLLSVILKTLRIKYKHNINNLFYPAASPNFSPLIRDILLLGVLRAFFKNVIIEFSAAGLSEYVKNSNPIIRYLALRVYGNANGAIQRSLLNPPDGEYFKAKEILTVQGGVPDYKYRTDFQKNNPQNPISILYAGIIHESKGVMVLLEAIRLVRDQNYNFKLSIMGEFTSNAFKNKVQQFISDNKLDDKVLLPGFKKGKDKWDQYNKADIFCFPTFYETESFGLVIVEAMMFELPVITTNWRAIPDIVSDSETGFLIPIKNSEILAEKIILLISDSELRKKMGYAGRKKYLNEFTMDRFVNRFELCVVETLKSN